WGSSIAGLGHKLKAVFGDVLKLKNFGALQLRDMTYGSDMIYSFLDLANSMNFRSGFRALSQNVRFLQISGTIRPFRLFPRLFSPNHIAETDLAMPLTSTVYDAIFYRERQARDVKNVSPNDFTRMDFELPRAVVEGWHMPQPYRMVGRKLAER